jgi:hypothetical protein
MAVGGVAGSWAAAGKAQRMIAAVKRVERRPAVESWSVFCI